MEPISRSEEIVDAREQLAALSQFYRTLDRRDINANGWPRIHRLLGEKHLTRER